jgi:hypothetical protein
LIDLGTSYQNASKEMALTTNVKGKSDSEFGLKLAKEIDGQLGASNSYYQIRNARFRANRLAANGKTDIRAKFADRLNMDGETNFANLNWKALMVTSTIISRLVGRWKLRKYKVSVTAIDPFSKEQKNDKFKEADFIFGHKEMLGQLQEASGVPQISQDDFVAEDQESLDTWAIEGNRLPEEINYELATNNVFTINGLYNVLCDKYLHDSSVVGLIAGYVEMNEEGIVETRYVQPENTLYSWSKFADFRDTEMRGELCSMTISQLRQLYGHKYTEEQFFELAQTAKNWNVTDKISWVDTWLTAWSRPYDDWNIDLIKFEYRTFDTDVYKIKETKSGSLIVEKDPAPNDKQGTRKVKGKWNIYKGVYAREKSWILEWGKKTNMIRPQDPKEIGEVEFGYSFYMYDMYDMTNLAVPEKIDQPVDAMQLELLKIQQCIAKSRPPGAAVNVDAVQELDLGLASGVSSPMEVQKIYDQTGNMYYRGRDASGQPIPVPITELSNTGFLNQIQGYINAYLFHYQTLKDQLGEDPNLMTAASQPRVAVQNIEVAQQSAATATDYMFDAVMSLYRDMSKKVACLMNDSITFGAKAYRDILKEKDVKGRVFLTEMEMMPSDIEIAEFRNTINQAISVDPNLLMFVDINKIFRVAKQNVKLADLYFQQGQKQYRRYLQEQTEQNQQATFQAQMASNKQAADAKMQQTDLEGTIDVTKSKTAADGANKSAIINMVTKLLADGTDIPPSLVPFMQVTIENLLLPMVAQNEEQEKAILQQMQAAANQAQQAPQQGQMPMQGEGMPPEQPPIAA